MTKRYAWPLLILGIALGLVGGFLDHNLMIALGVLTAALGLVLQAHNYRCPHCGRKVHTDKLGNHQKCPHCGGELDQPK